MNVTRAPIGSPMRSASSSSSATAAWGVPRPSRSAARRASATSVVSIVASICRRIVVANSVPATARAMTAADRAAKKNFVWYVVRNGAGMWLRRGLHQLVAELLDRDEAVRQHGQLFPQPPHVDL